MFKISLAQKDEIEIAEKYLEYKSSGIIMILKVKDEFAGAVCFDLTADGAVIEKLKVDVPELKSVTAKAALNFLDLHAVRDVKVYEDFDFYKTLGFKSVQHSEAGAEPVMSINLEGYFTSSEKGC